MLAQFMAQFTDNFLHQEAAQHETEFVSLSSGMSREPFIALK
jgi:hypothetical protein